MCLVYLSLLNNVEVGNMNGLTCIMNLTDIFYKYSEDTSGSCVGVFVCGSESMKESVASCCMLNLQDLNKCTAQKRKPFFSFHSLNFTL